MAFLYCGIVSRRRLEACGTNFGSGMVVPVPVLVVPPVVEVLLPEEIRTTHHGRTSRPGAGAFPGGIDFDADFLNTRALRRAIHVRERGHCFYCLRRLTPMIRCLDHVVPRVSFGSNSYRNLVSCCLQCNSQKGARPAADFLRSLYRHRRLTDAELTARLRALDALASGKLPPPLVTTANPLPRKGRPPLYPATP